MIGIGIANSLGVNLSGLSPAAKSFVTAAGISDPTKVKAINDLVIGLQSSGLWSKMKAVYPFVTDNRNLLGYTEAFDNGAWIKENATISANATTAPNGTLTADKLQEDNTTNKHDFYFDGIAGNGIASTIGQTYTISIYAKAAERNFMQIAFGTGQVSGNPRVNFNISNGTITAVDSGITATIESVGNGWYRCNSSVTAATGFLTFITQTQTSGTAARFATYLGTTGSGIFAWGAQLELGSTATTYQPIATTQQAFISNQFKYNLVNPVDSDAAFRLVFNGGWTFSTNGATPNGTNGYADTKLIPNTNLTLNSASFSVYSRNNVTPGPNNQSFGVSSQGSFIPLIGTTMLTTKGVNSYVYNFLTPDLLTSAVNQNLAAMFLTTRTAANNAKSFRNTTQLASVTTQGQTTQPTTSFTFGAFRNSTSIQDYATFEHAFAHIGDGLTDTEAANLYTRVQAFQTALSRQV